MSDSVRAQFVCDAEHLKLLHEINARQTLYVPLKARGRTIGALSLALLYDRYANAEDQLALVEELAGRAALALDNAELYEQQRTVAQALQQSLLPATLPTLEGFDIASRYRSAGEGNVVGGDFYDVFETSHGWAIIIGDVSGKGPEAASVTALARYTLQAAAMHGGGPSQALEALNATLLRAHGGKRFCTVVFCELARSEPHATLRLAAAGHPPPLLLRKDCSVDQLAADGGLPLGLWPNIEIRDHKVQLSAEDIVLFYTDGLTDARAPEIIFSADDIASLMLTCAGLDAQATAARLEQAVLLPHTDTIRDDMAIVTLKVLTADGKS
jgi:serine phosphatase RsbU (regulator of sigma subunit)